MTRVDGAATRRIAGTIPLVLAAVVVLTACGSSELSTKAASDGDTLPSVSLPVLGEQTTVDTASWRGQPTVINFWATWCAFCVEEMPDFQAVSRDVADEVRFVGVDREDRVTEALELARRTGVTYTLVEDPDGSFFRSVGARGMPTTLFVSADGAVLYSHAGPLTERRLRELLREHFAIDS